MTSKLVALALLCLMSGTAMAQAQGHAAHVQDLPEESRQGSSGDHSGACAGRVERHPPTQCTCVRLRWRAPL